MSQNGHEKKCRKKVPEKKYAKKSAGADMFVLLCCLEVELRTVGAIDVLSVGVK